MNYIAPILTSLAALVTSIALLINAFSKLKKEPATTLGKQGKNNPDNTFANLTFWFGAAAVVSSVGCIFFMILQPIHPATSRDIGFAALLVTNVVMGIFDMHIASKLKQPRIVVAD
jgi:hypothetical protein